MNIQLPADLAALLLPWYARQHRDLPWRHTKDPYAVWLSEIMLQQTRVEAVKGYYHRFLEALPNIAAMANCPEDRLLKLWEGLGYYSRARNLKKAAQRILEQHGGSFPQEHAAVLALPGIGEYTAGAICSICFGTRTPAVDGNVLRVCTRLSACRENILHPATKKAVTGALLKVFPQTHCGDMNQALMELGATVCIPHGEPDCFVCPLRERCRSALGALWREIPLRSPKKERPVEEKTVFLLRCGGKLALRKRPDRGLLAGLWEFPCLPGIMEPQAVLDQATVWGCQPLALLQRRDKKHIFTHREWHMAGYELLCAKMSALFAWADETELEGLYSLPTAFRKFHRGKEPE